VQGTGEFGNRYLMECVRRFPGRFSAVMVVDADNPDALEALAHWVGEGAEGVRLGPITLSPGSDPLAAWRKTAELGSPPLSMATEWPCPRCRDWPDAREPWLLRPSGADDRR